jgi:hypothetical protein
VVQVLQGESISLVEQSRGDRYIRDETPGGNTDDVDD